MQGYQKTVCMKEKVTSRQCFDPTWISIKSDWNVVMVQLLWHGLSVQVLLLSAWILPRPKNKGLLDNMTAFIWLCYDHWLIVFPLCWNQFLQTYVLVNWSNTTVQRALLFAQRSTIETLTANTVVVNWNGQGWATNLVKQRLLRYLQTVSRLFNVLQLSN